MGSYNLAQNLLRHRDILISPENYLFKGKGTPYLTSVIPLPSRGYSPRKPTVRSFYPPLSISAPFKGYLKLLRLH